RTNHGGGLNKKGGQEKRRGGGKNRQNSFSENIEKAVQFYIAQHIFGIILKITKNYGVEIQKIIQENDLLQNLLRIYTNVPLCLLIGYL
ncbi:MAG: hypothetical protein KIH08_14395, partial [Candidatus Freyarchaeota archaeon]|nr:hypothetical protein [Candidatus Jordarchaeia archaeon]